MNIRFGYADTAGGQVHYAECGGGAGLPVVLLHQTPRSWDEFRDVLPPVGKRRRAIAVDLPGFGASYRPAEYSIEAFAAGTLAALDTLGVRRFVLCGHHTGGVVAVEMAARTPERVAALVLSSTPYLDVAARERRRSRPPIDEVEPRPDGAHLTELWRRRQAFYPPDRPDLLLRFVTDALRVGDRLEDGHRAVGAYRMEQRISAIGCPALCVGASADPHAFGDLHPLADRIPGARTTVIDGGMVPLPDQMPGPFAALVTEAAEAADAREGAHA